MQQRLDEERDHFIPVRKRDILEALTESLDAEERQKFGQLCRLLGAIFHYEYFDRLERLRDDYFYFNPERETPVKIDAERLDSAYRDMMDALISVLKGANFVEVPPEEIARAQREHAVLRVQIETPVEDFREVRFFRRGRHREEVDISDRFGLRKRKVEFEVYDNVVMFAAVKTAAEIGSQRELKRMTRGRLRPGSVLIKYFRNIASADLNMLFPNVRVVMGTADKLFLGLPALAGAIPILINLASTVTVLFLVIGFYLGVVSAIEDDQMKAALAAMSGVIALGGFVMRQWVKYQRQSLKYQKELADNVYFRNINNNAGIFDYIIGAAEEQECKEAFLAYHFLHVAKAPLEQDELDRRIEAWLRETFAADIDFEVNDALAKLVRLGVLHQDGSKLSVPPLDAALARLDRVWDDYFAFGEAAATDGVAADPAAASLKR